MKARLNIGIRVISSLLLASLFFISCVEFEQVSPIPEIKYVEFDMISGIDSVLGNEVKFAQIKFNFVDGDADFGVYRDVNLNTQLPDSIRYNLFLTLYDKVDGLYTPNQIWIDSTSSFEDFTLNYPIFHDSKLDRVGQNKTVKGVITSNTQITSWDHIADTFRIEFYVRDRALNKSNVEHTIDYSLND